MSPGSRYCLWLAMMLCGQLAGPVGAYAQPLVLPARDRGIGSQPEFHHLRRLPHDPATQSLLAKAQEAIDRGSPAEGLESLQLILDEGIDFFMITENQIDGSLRTQVESIIRQHRDDYERLQGNAARQLLNQSIADRDERGIHEVIRRYSMTDAGRDALALLVRMSRQNGDLGRGALFAQVLAAHPSQQDAGRASRQGAALAMADHAPELARTLLTSTQGETIARIDEFLQGLSNAGESGVPRGADVPQSDWRFSFGGRDQSAHSDLAPIVGSIAWSVPLINDSAIEQMIVAEPDVRSRLLTAALDTHLAARQQVRQSEGRITFPAGRPLVVGNEVIVAGPGTFHSFDAATGTHRWASFPKDETFRHLYISSASSEKVGDAYRAEMCKVVASVRGFLDRTFGSLSTDGKYVYAVTDCQCVGTTSQQRAMQNRLRHPLVPQLSNLLLQLDLSREGSLRHDLGVPNEESPRLFDDEPERSIFFLGAPASLDGVLYVLGEEQGQIQLFAIDPETFSITWSLGLLNPDQVIKLAETRRISGLVPVYGGGLLICPTGEGVLCAVDPVRRQLVWSHQYRLPVDGRSEQRLRQRMFSRQTQIWETVEQMLDEERWFDSRLIVSGDYLAFTPPDHDGLLVLNVHQGVPVWEHEFPRRQMIELAAIYDERLVLLGRRDISCIRLADGSPAWPEAIPIPPPSGRGLRMGDQYLQPLSTNEIAVVELKTGRLLGRIPFPGEEPPGNLVAGNGAVYAQSSIGLTAFRQRSDLERELASSGDVPPQKLELLGQWQLQQGRLNEAIETLQRAVRNDGSAAARRILAGTLLDGLRTDFATYRQMIPEIQSLLSEETEKLQFLRIYAQGLQRSGDSRAALESYLNFLESLPEAAGMLRDIESGRTVTDRRWALARIEEILDPKNDPDAQHRALFEQWLTSTPNKLEGIRILNSLPVQWFSAAMVLKAASSAPRSEAGTFLQLSLLMKLRTLPEPQVCADALAELAALCLRIGDGELAEAMLDELGRFHPDVALSRGERADQFVASVRANAFHAAVLNGVPNWPTSVSLAADQGTQSPHLQRMNLFQIPVLGPVSPSFEGWTFHTNPIGAEIEIQDASGRLREKIKIGVEQTLAAGGLNLARHVETRGPLAMIVLIDRVLIVDLLSSGSERRETVSRLLISEKDSPYMNRSFPTPASRIRSGMRSFTATTPWNTLAGNVGPLCDSVVCLGCGTELIALDPRTGEVLWKRQDLIQGSEIFGDERYVVVRPPAGNVLNLYRAADGEYLHTSEIPTSAIPYSVGRNLGDWGRYLPCVSSSDQSLRWSLFDPVSQMMIWELDFPAGTVWTSTNGIDLAFLTPEGRLTFHSGRTGREFLKSEISLELPVRQLTVIEFPDRYVVATGNSPRNFSHFESFGVSIADLIRRQVDGRMAAIDRSTGAVFWEKKIDSQELLTQYPKKWPVLLMASRTTVGKRIDAKVYQRFTGEEIWKQTLPGDDAATILNWIGETQPMRIRLRIGKTSVVFDCRDSLTTGK